MARSYPTTRMCDGEFLAMFEPTTRDTDVFLTTTAKCGQTWLQGLLFHLKTHGREPDYRGEGLGGVSPWLELPIGFLPGDADTDRAARLARMERLEDPRVFKMHVVWDEVPRPPGSRARVMTVTRDPRDVPYSMFSHLKAMREGAGPPPPADFGAYFEQWLDFGFYFKFVKAMWPHKDDSDVLWLRYEDLHRNLRGEAGRIVEFLGWTLEDGDLDRVLPLVDFARMRKAEKETIFREHGKAWKEDGHFFREGAIGANRTHLSAEQEGRIVERARVELGEECCRFLFDG